MSRSGAATLTLQDRCGGQEYQDGSGSLMVESLLELCGMEHGVDFEIDSEDGIQIGQVYISMNARQAWAFRIWPGTGFVSWLHRRNGLNCLVTSSAGCKVDYKPSTFRFEEHDCLPGRLATTSLEATDVDISRTNCRCSTVRSTLCVNPYPWKSQTSQTRPLCRDPTRGCPAEPRGLNCPPPP